MKIAFQSIVFVLAVQFAMAQESMKSTHPDATNCDDSGYCWGDKREEGKVKYAMYSDRYNFGDYAWKDAEPALDWLITNIPYLSYTVYVNGYKIYDYLEEHAETEDEKVAYQDKLLSLMDKRITYFGGEADVLQRKGVKAYPYLIKRGKEYYDGLFELYDRIYELNGKDTYRSNLLYLMAMVKTQHATKKIGDDMFMDYLDKVSATIDENKKAGDANEVEKWETVASQIDDMIPEELLDCEMISQRMGKKLEEEPDNVELAKKTLKYLVKGKCYDAPVFLLAAEKVFDIDKSGSLASIIAKKYASTKDYNTALEWYDKGIDAYADEKDKQGEFYFEKAQIYSVLGKLSDARSAAVKSVELNPDNNSKAYTLIGDLYMSSGNVCNETNPVKFRAIYLAAYDAYAIAGANGKMANAKAQFPSMEEIHIAGMKIGDSIDVGCWIGGKTEIRKRM